jgi:hypothetical protein
MATSGLLQKFISYIQKSEIAGIRRKFGVEKPETLDIKP